ncbi:hypothetical protein [Synechococcus sp. MIT S1220]|uniref:hypothetical protein n=1 Tax=Synechococcus sp. MIT S1220 TaxID=3082549 RepID=UPI0039B03934
MTDTKPTILEVTNNSDNSPGESVIPGSLRDAINKSQSTDGGKYNIRFKVPSGSEGDPLLGTGYFTIRLKQPLPNIYRNEVLFNPENGPVASVTLLPGEFKDSVKTPQAQIQNESSGIGDPSGSLMYIGDVNLIHDNQLSKSYSGQPPVVSINNFNFVKNIAKGGTGERGAGGAVGVGGGITFSAGHLTIKRSIFQDLIAQGGGVS